MLLCMGSGAESSNLKCLADKWSNLQFLSLGSDSEFSNPNFQTRSNPKSDSDILPIQWEAWAKCRNLTSGSIGSMLINEVFRHRLLKYFCSLLYDTMIVTALSVVLRENRKNWLAAGYFAPTL